MPAKITKTKTDNSTGEISMNDVSKTINDFITSVQLSCTDSTRNALQKYCSFDLKIDRINQVIAGSAGANADKIRINLSLNLPGQMNCKNTESIENYLSILVCAVDANGTSLLNENDMILADGFADYGESSFLQTDCCVNGTPPPQTH